MRIAGLSLLIGLALVGCQKAEAPKLTRAAAASIPADWTLATDAASGVSIGLPPGWRVGMPRMIGSDSMMSPETEGANPNAMAAAGEMLGNTAPAANEQAALDKLREKGIVLHCVDSSKAIPGENPTRITVTKIADAGFSLLKDAVESEEGSMHSEGKGTAVKLPVGQAVRLKAQGRNRIGDEECHVSYVMVDGKDAYVLRFESTNNPGVILDIEAAVAQTFRVK